MKTNTFLTRIFGKIYDKLDQDLKSRKPIIVKKLKKLVKKGHMNKDIENDLREFIRKQIETTKEKYDDKTSRNKWIKEYDDVLNIYVNDHFLSEDYIGKYCSSCIKDDRIYKCVEFVDILYDKLDSKDSDIRGASETIIRYLDDILNKYT